MKNKVARKSKSDGKDRSSLKIINNADADSECEEMEERSHKKGLQNLDKLDPEFYQYLQENDKDLLDFGKSDSEEDLEDEEKTEAVHKLPDDLENASDESDFEDGVSSSGTVKVSLTLVNEWAEKLRNNKRRKQPISTVVKAFHAALLRAMGEVTDDKTSFKVDGSSVFNAVVQLCVTEIYPSLARVLNLPSSNVSKKHVQKSKRWPLLKDTVRFYIVDLTKLIGNVTSENVLCVLLKHLHQMMPLASCLPTITRALLKRLVLLWSKGQDDSVRIVAFLCIIHLVVSDIPAYLHDVLKMMYMAYVANSKFVSPNSLPAINLMRKSLSELYSLNEQIAYHHVFIYIRQLAIHLRSAVVVNKKESMQAVYSWQYVSSLRLWTDVLSKAQNNAQFQTLVYPLIQIIIGCIKLVTTAQYMPLRFHCIEMLNTLQCELGVYIPVIPFLSESLSLIRVNDPHSKLSMRPMDFTYVLRLSKSQLQENAFKDATVECFHHYTLQYLANESYRISFPDTAVVVLIQIKQFLKDCKNSNYNKKLKILIDKIQETCKLIDSERTKCAIALHDEKMVAAWESKMKANGTPLTAYYTSWHKLYQQQIARKTTNNIQLGEYNLPTLKKAKKSAEKSLPKSDEPVELFPSDDEDDIDDADGFLGTKNIEKQDFANRVSQPKKNKGRKPKDNGNDGKNASGKKRKSKNGSYKDCDVENGVASKKPKYCPVDDNTDTPDSVQEMNLPDFLSS